MNPLPSNLDGSLFHDASIGIAVINSVSGLIRDANDKYCSLLGVARDRLVGSSWMLFTHPDDVEKDTQFIRDLYRGGKRHAEREKRYIRPDGTVVYARVSLTRLEIGAENPHHIVMVEDMTRLYITSQRMKSCILQVHANRDAVINSLAVLAMFRDRETGDHLKRTELYVQLLLENLPAKYTYSRHGIDTIAHASILHDIGKVGIPDSILLKEGCLSENEFTIMKTHTTLGGNAIQETMRYLPNDIALSFAKEIAENHHEWWNGAGYPNGLKGDEIPLSARVMALADVYDALRSLRVYKKAYSHRESVNLILSESGTHFDPGLVAVFLGQEGRFAQIADESHPEKLAAGAGFCQNS